MEGRQYLDCAVTSKLTRLHVVELILSPLGQTLVRHVDRSFGRGLNDLESVGSDMHVGRR